MMVAVFVRIIGDSQSCLKRATKHLRSGRRKSRLGGPRNEQAPPIGINDDGKLNIVDKHAVPWKTSVIDNNENQVEVER
jgi:hypothetical protein